MVGGTGKERDRLMGAGGGGGRWLLANKQDQSVGFSSCEKSLVVGRSREERVGRRESRWGTGKGWAVLPTQVDVLWVPGYPGEEGALFLHVFEKMPAFCWQLQSKWPKEKTRSSSFHPLPFAIFSPFHLLLENLFTSHRDVPFVRYSVMFCFLWVPRAAQNWDWGR